MIDRKWELTSSAHSDRMARISLWRALLDDQEWRLAEYQAREPVPTEGDMHCFPIRKEHEDHCRRLRIPLTTPEAYYHKRCTNCEQWCPLEKDNLTTLSCNLCEKYLCSDCRVLGCCGDTPAFMVDLDARYDYEYYYDYDGTDDE